MSDEATFDRLQIGAQGALGSTVAATDILAAFPLHPLDVQRLVTISDVDVSAIGRNYKGQAHQFDPGMVSFPINGPLTFEQAHHLIRMSVAGSATASGSGPYIYDYPADERTSSIIPYTIQAAGESLTERVSDCYITDLRLGFDAMRAGEASPWTYSAIVEGWSYGSATPTSLDPPTGLEPMQGQATRLYHGSKSTAYDDLAELPGSLVGYNLDISDPKPRSIMGDGSQRVGRLKRLGTVEALLKIDSSTTAATWDIFDVLGGQPTERRWRIEVTGSDSRAFRIDHQIVFTSVPVLVDEGQRVYSIRAEIIAGSLDFGITVPEPLIFEPVFLGVACSNSGTNETSGYWAGEREERVQITAAEIATAGNTVIAVTETGRSSIGYDVQVYDQRGNTWTMDAEKRHGTSEHTVRIWRCNVTTTIQAGDWIRFAHRSDTLNPAIDTAPRCMGAFAFAGTLSVDTVGTGASGFTSTPTISTPAGAVVVAACGLEEDDSNGLTDDPTWTDMVPFTQVGSSAFNMACVVGQYLLDNGADTWSATIDQTRVWAAISVSYARS